MNDNISILRLQDAWRECERNIYYLCNALTSLDPVLPMTVERFGRLMDTQVQAMDQFILRFTKLQDAMGGRLFPAILAYLQEPNEERQKIRMTRNRFAHDYPDDWSKNSALINVACEAAAEMYCILIGIENKLRTERSGHVLVKSLPEFVLSKTLKNG